MMPRTTRRALDLPSPGQGVWPGLWSPPRSVVRARIAETLFRRAVRTVPVRVVLPGGHVLGAGGPDAPDMRLRRPEAFFRRLGVDVDSREFGRDYAETLRRWRERFLSRWDEVAALGFDDTFRRMWEFYLAYSEAGFRVGHLGVRQFAAVK